MVIEKHVSLGSWLFALRYAEMSVSLHGVNLEER